MNDVKQAPKTLEQALHPEEVQKKNWSAFVEADVADFFIKYDIEKMSIDDGRGNKAKLTRTKDNDIKVEYTSSITL
ncbi:MAG: hypothetical protein RR387_01690 [Clostridiales bacterium]